MWLTYKQSNNLWYKKQKPKVVNIFCITQIMLNFQNEMQNLDKSTHFEKFILIQQWLT
jgi:hypothetical protein